MNLAEKPVRNMLLIWIFMGVPMMAALYLFFPSQPIDSEIFFCLLFFAIITAANPLQFGHTKIILTQWVTLAAFLIYGTGAEILIAQLAMLPVIYQMRNRKNVVFHSLFISFMFICSTFVAATVVHLLGFEVGHRDLWHLFNYGVVFVLVALFVNEVMIYVRNRLNGANDIFITNHFKWSYGSMIITIPFAFSLVVMIYQVGASAIVLLGIPYFVMANIVKMYNTSERVNSLLSKASEFGYELADRLSAQQIIELFMYRVSELFAHDAMYLVDSVQGNYIILLARVDGKQRKIEVNEESIRASFIHSCFQNESKRCYRKAKEWSKQAPHFFPKDMNSVMLVPIQRNQQTEGMVILAARRKNAFENYQMDIVHLLSTYFAVSLEKAKYLHEAVEKSETCALTGLYNYRYLDKMLVMEQERIDANPHLQFSVLIMDIDFFKRINDTYGHHAGNQVLGKFSEIVESLVPEGGVLARYGGEEFVMLIPHMDKTSAVELGNLIRQRVALTPFLIESDLAGAASEEILFITVSIGVSNIPEDASNTKGLLRNADHALYVGAKRAGRNKVACYAK